MERKSSIAWEVTEGAGWVYFDRPEKLNALPPGSARDMWACLNALEARREVRVLVFTGRGKAFCAGMDLGDLEGSAPLAARRRARETQMITDRIAESFLPTIAAVNGVAMGLGLEICLACDLALATPEAQFAFAELRLGMIPSGGGTQRLARLVGLRRAQEMLLSGRVVDAETAAAWGLVNRVVMKGELEDEVRRWVERIAQGGRTAVYLAKRCLNRSLDLDLDRGMELELESFTTCFASGEPARNMRRFAVQRGAGGEPEARGTEVSRREEGEPTPEASSPVGSEGGEDEAGEEEELFE